MRKRARTEYGDTVSVLATRNVLQYAKSRGVDMAALARELRIDLASLDNPEGRIALSVHRRAWALASLRSHDAAFGLHLAERSGIGTLEVLDYALWASSTLDDALDRIVRFYRLLGDDLELHLVRSGAFVRLHRVVQDERHRAEAYFAFIVLRSRELARSWHEGQRVAPSVVVRVAQRMLVRASCETSCSHCSSCSYRHSATRSRVARRPQRST